MHRRWFSGLVERVKISELNRQLEHWRTDAKKAHGYTDAQLAKLIGYSESALAHKASEGTLYRMPFYKAMRLKELANK